MAHGKARGAKHYDAFTFSVLNSTVRVALQRAEREIVLHVAKEERESSF